MKKKITLLVLTTLSFTFSYAQRVFKEGEIVFSTEWQLPEGAPEAMKGSLPSEVSTFYKDSKSFSEISINMMGQAVVVRVFLDNNPMSSTLLMDMMGQKVGIYTSPEDFKKVYDTLQLSFDYQNEYKDIIGFKCRKVIMKNGALKEPSEMWVTEELAVPLSQYTMYYKNLRGVPLEFLQSQNGMKIKLVAKSITDKPIPDDKFVVPGGYRVIPFAEAIKMGFQK